MPWIVANGVEVRRVRYLNIYLFPQFSNGQVTLLVCRKIVRNNNICAKPEISDRFDDYLFATIWALLYSRHSGSMSKRRFS
jgi:hypothetical protein